MKTILVFILLIFGKFSFPQSYIAYHNTCNSACELMIKGDYYLAIDSLNNAINSVEKPRAIDLFNLSKCYAQTNQKDSCIYFLEASLKMENLKSMLNHHNLWFEPLLGKDKWTEVKNKDYYQLPKLENWQLKLIDHLKQLETIDQHYRLLLYDSIEVWHPLDTLLHKTYQDSIAINDSITHSELEKIIVKHGWPGYYVTGQRKTLVNIILLHSNDTWFEKMKSILIKEIEKGNLNPNAYAMIADRVQLRNNQPPLYNGYFAHKNEVTPKIISNCKTIGRTLPNLREHRP